MVCAGPGAGMRGLGAVLSVLAAEACRALGRGAQELSFRLIGAARFFERLAVRISRGAAKP